MDPYQLAHQLIALAISKEIEAQEWAKFAFSSSHVQKSEVLRDTAERLREYADYLYQGISYKFPKPKNPKKK